MSPLGNEWVSVGEQELLQKGVNLELTKKRLADLDVAIADTESTIRCFRLASFIWKPIYSIVIFSMCRK